MIRANRTSRWPQGAYDVWLLEGNCSIQQGTNRCRSDEAVLWIRHRLAPDESSNQSAPNWLPRSGLSPGGFGPRPARAASAGSNGFGARGRPASTPPDSFRNPTPDDQNKVIAFLEGNVEIDCSGTPRTGTSQPRAAANSLERGWLGRFYSAAPLQMNVPRPGPEPMVKPAVYHDGMARRDPNGAVIRRTQFTQPGAAAPPADDTPVGSRRIRFFQRSAVPFNFQARTTPGTDERQVVLTGGVNILIDGLPSTQGTLDVSADRIVLWTRGGLDPAGREQFQDEKVPLEVYLEGNVEFREGERVVYADEMFYDVNREIATILHGEILEQATKMGGTVRVKSDVIRQLNGSQFSARQSNVTTSAFLRPRYRIQSSDIFVQDQQIPKVDPRSGVPLTGPDNQPQYEHERILTSRNNLFFVGPVPVFYWPRFATNMEEPSTLLVSAYFQKDNIFGYWTEAEVDAFQLLGIKNQPEGTDWTFTVSDLTKRGIGGGTWFQYDRPIIANSGTGKGTIDVWGLHDNGFDNLGRGRFGLTPESRFRGRVLGTYRQTFADDFVLGKGYQLTGELGLISDYNFLEQYYETEWDTQKDQTTGLEFKRYRFGRSWSVNADYRVNPFFTDTNWLPRGDFYHVGVTPFRNLLGDRLTWYEHSDAGYAQYRVQNAPTNPQDLANFQYLPWELNPAGTPANVGGARYVTTQELDAPFNLGPVKVVPYVLGQLAHWDADLSGNGVDRAFGQGGLRASIPFWSVNPNIQSTLLNVHGIAHKMVFDVDASASDANRSFFNLPLYDAIDDNTQERFRQRTQRLDYGGTLPLIYDPRLYALRYGMQNWVTSPSAELVGRFAAVRMGWHQRWQTKRGPTGNRRIVDWITLDTNAVYYPDPNRDNFGTPFGLVTYDFRWHVGDRVTVLSDSAVDFFQGGQKTYSIGANLARPPRVNWNLSLRSFNGPFTYNVFNLTHSYQMSDRYLYSAGTSFALGGKGNIGENVMITRLGEAFAMTLMLYIDAGKNNQGFNFMLTPRFLGGNNIRMGSPNLPPVGTYGLQ